MIDTFEQRIDKIWRESFSAYPARRGRTLAKQAVSNGYRAFCAAYADGTIPRRSRRWKRVLDRQILFQAGKLRA